MRKLPLSLTRLAAFGFSETINVSLCNHLEQGRYYFDGTFRSGGQDEQLRFDRGFRSSKHWGDDELLPALFVLGCQSLSQGDANRARGDVDRAFRQRGEHALIAIDDTFDGIIIGKHGEDDFASAGFCDR
jgi:hypothetical protein